MSGNLVERVGGNHTNAVATKEVATKAHVATTNIDRIRILLSIAGMYKEVMERVYVY